MERVHGESATKLGSFPVSPVGLGFWSTSTALSVSSRTWPLISPLAVEAALQKLKQSRHRISQRFPKSYLRVLPGWGRRRKDFAFPESIPPGHYALSLLHLEDLTHSTG